MRTGVQETGPLYGPCTLPLQGDPPEPLGAPGQSTEVAREGPLKSRTVVMKRMDRGPLREEGSRVPPQLFQVASSPVLGRGRQ